MDGKNIAVIQSRMAAYIAITTTLCTEEKHYACYWSLVAWGTSWDHHPAVPFPCHLTRLAHIVPDAARHAISVWLYLGRSALSTIFSMLTRLGEPVRGVALLSSTSWQPERRRQRLTAEVRRNSQRGANDSSHWSLKSRFIL